jgi:flagellin-like protein
VALRTILKSRKGISPILATLLLIVIVVAAIVVAYMWVMTYMGNTTQQAGVLLYKANVNFVSGKIVVDVGNSGTSDTTIIGVYVGTSASNMQSYTPTFATSSSLAAGTINSFSVDYAWENATMYYFKVVPAAQQALTFPAKAPEPSPQGGSSWWNSQYGYRQLITVTNNEALMLPAGYSVEVTLDTASLVSAGKMLSDCSDLRIAYLQGSSWVELDRDVIDGGTSATQVWFKTQAAIGASPSADSDYYVYYGNPSASNPPANKNNVYLWFDDFNRPDETDITSEDAYSKTNGGSWSIEGDMLKNTGAAGDPNKLIVNALGTVNCGVEMSIKLKVTNWLGNGDEGRMGLTCDMDTPNGEGYCGLFHNDLNTIALLNDLRSWGSSTTFSWSTNTWYEMRFKVTDCSAKQGQLKTWLTGTSEPSSWALNGSFGGGSARGYGSVGVAGSRRGDVTYFDDFQVRYAVNLEPSVSLGAPETL